MDKHHWKNREDLKTDIDQLIGFVEKTTNGGDEEEKLIPSTAKVEDQNLKVKMPSKYATILTCSFEKNQKMVLGGESLP
jgi:hypothetical protein